MHLSKLFLVTFTTTVAYAQTGNATADAAMLPACVRSCFTLGVDSVGCAITDFSCHCSPAHNASIYAIAMPCTAKNCTTAETQSMCSFDFNFLFPFPLPFSFSFLGPGQKLHPRSQVHPALPNHMMNSANKNVPRLTAGLALIADICRITLASNTSSSVTATSAPTTTISVPSMPSSLASTSAVRMGGLSTFLLGLVAVGGMAASVGLL